MSKVTFEKNMDVPWTEEQRRFICGDPQETKSAREAFVPDFTPWTPEQEARIRGVLVRSSDRSLGRQRQEEARQRPNYDCRDDPQHQARMQDFLGEHYETVKAEVDFRRDLMNTAAAMEDGRLPFTLEAAAALIGRQQDWLDTHRPRIIPPGDLNFDALQGE